MPEEQLPNNNMSQKFFAIAGEASRFRNTLCNTQTLVHDVAPCIPRTLVATAGPVNDTHGGRTQYENSAYRAAMADAMAYAMADAMAVARADAIAAAMAVAIAAANAAANAVMTRQ